MWLEHAIEVGVSEAFRPCDEIGQASSEHGMRPRTGTAAPARRGPVSASWQLAGRYLLVEAEQHKEQHKTGCGLCAGAGVTL